MLEVKTLGELKQPADAGTARALRRKPLALLCYLARRAPRAVPRTELATLFWGERGEDRARQSLRQALLELKQAVGDAVEIDAESVSLAAGAVELDLSGFERDAAAGRLEEAAARWTGDFFEGGEDIGGEGFRRWIESERAGLHQQLRIVMEKLIGDAERRGDWNGASAWATRWAAALPFDEQAHFRLIESLRMSGKSAEALAAHAGFVSRVRAALDLEPSGEFLRLGGGLADDARSELARKGRGSAAVQTPSLVGRGPILAALTDAWREAVAGSPAVVLVRGEPGSGLTRIGDELLDRAGMEAVVLQARGSAALDLGTAAELCEPFRQAPGRAGAAPDALAEVARLVPALAAQFPHLPAATGEPAALRDGLAQILAAISDERPVLALVDDAHAADEGSRRLLAGLAARLTGRVLLVLLEDETSPTPLRDLSAARNLRRVHLEPLDLGDTEAMVASMVAMEPEDRRALAVRLHGESGGAPLAIRELISALVDDHLLVLDPAGRWRTVPALVGRPLPVPGPIRERTAALLASLSPPARALAETLAVLAEPAGSDVAAAVAELAPDDATAGLDELVSRHLLHEVPEQPGRFGFPTVLLGRTVAGLIPPTRRQTLHGRAAVVLSERDLAVTAERSLLPYHVARAEAQPSGSAPVAGRGRFARAAGAVAAALVVIAAVAAVVMRGGSAGRIAAEGPGGGAVVALGRITDYRAETAADLTKPLTDMLATNLGRIPRLRVVSTARMYELVSQADPTGRDTSAAALVAAARRAGASELVEGALYARDDGGFRLDLRRVELATGRISQTHSVAGPTIFELADSGTARLAADFGAATPAGSIADVTTRSVSAYRLYEEGLRAFYANDLRAAEPLFLAALAEDSSFAMAAYYAAMSATGRPRELVARLGLAARLAARASDRERLTILAYEAFMASSPALGPIADTLMIRYPTEREGYFYGGLSLMVEGEFLRALPLLNRVVAMDSLALATNQARCLACDAFRQIISAYQMADSLPAAEREARRWIRLQPRSPAPWQLLADVLTQRGRPDDALEALDQQAALDAGRREALRVIDRALHRIYAGDYQTADRLLASEVESGSPYRRLVATWYRILSFRQQGRLAEALVEARRHRANGLPAYPRGAGVALRAAPPEALAEGQVLYEMGRYRESAAVFDSVARWRTDDYSPSQNAHATVWARTHAIGSLVAAGDTAGLMARADTLERLGAQSGSGRDRRLHHHIRGLALAAEGRDQAAIEEFPRAVYSWNYGYTRVNVALAAGYRRLGRPRDAVAVLQPALRGSPEASNYYVTRTELHRLLAEAWDAVGPSGRDSALAHYRLVDQAWSRADSSFADRRREVAARIAALTR